MGRIKAQKRKAEVSAFAASPEYSIGDPALAEFLGLTGWGYGADITEYTALGLTAVYRAQALIAGTIAGLPLKVYEGEGSSRREVDHFLSSWPAGPFDLSPFSWVEMLMLHLLNHGEAYLKSIANEGGALIGLWPVHPNAISTVKWIGADKAFDVMMANGTTERLMTGELTQVLGLTTDGLRGISPLSIFRESIQTSKAGEKAANRQFISGALIGGLVTTEEDVDETEAKAIKANLNAKMAGAEHAGDIAFINRNLKFSPWAMNNADAQFIESRKFQVEEVARIYGLPTNLLSATGAVSNWGTGVAEANLGLQKYVLMGWTSRIEASLRAILPPGQFAEFDYKGLLQGSPADEIGLLIEQVTAGILTKDEAREVLNRPPLPKEPVPVSPPAQAPAPQ